MGRLWLVIDTPCLAYRAFYSTGGMSYAGVDTGVTYGVLRDVLALQGQFATPYTVFAFEHGRSLRREIYPEYKANRRWGLVTEEDLERREAMLREVTLLRTKYLPAIGFANVFSQKGYEADDIIAAVCQQSLPPEDRALIVSSDADLWQLLNRRVRIYNPQKKQVVNEAWFREQWGLRPTQWVDVKALAGCATDNVRGIKGIGDKRAAAYLAGTLPTKGTPYASILKGREIWERNLPLVKLPYPGTKTPFLSAELPTTAGWKQVLDELGIKSLR